MNEYRRPLKVPKPTQDAALVRYLVGIGYPSWRYESVPSFAYEVWDIRKDRCSYNRTVRP